jgi:hypothetical protein
MFLRSPAARECAGKHGDGEIGRCVAAGNGFDDARRREGECNESPDVTLAFVRLLNEKTARRAVA